MFRWEGTKVMCTIEFGEENGARRKLIGAGVTFEEVGGAWFTTGHVCRLFLRNYPHHEIQWRHNLRNK